MKRAQQAKTCIVKETMEKHGMNLLQQAIEETVHADAIPKTKLTVVMITEKLCCGAYERQATIKVEAYEQNGKMFFLNPVDMPHGWDRFSLKCTRNGR